MVAIDSLHYLVIEDADLMYLGRQLGEFPVVLDGGFIYGDDLKTLVKEARFWLLIYGRGRSLSLGLWCWAVGYPIGPSVQSFRS